MNFKRFRLERFGVLLPRLGRQDNIVNRELMVAGIAIGVGDSGGKSMNENEF